MAWTFPTALFFCIISALLILMTMLAIRCPRHPARRHPAHRDDARRPAVHLAARARPSSIWPGSVFFGPDLIWVALILCLVYAVGGVPLGLGRVTIDPAGRATARHKRTSQHLGGVSIDETTSHLNRDGACADRHAARPPGPTWTRRKPSSMPRSTICRRWTAPSRKPKCNGSSMPPSPSPAWTSRWCRKPSPPMNTNPRCWPRPSPRSPASRSPTT